MKRRFFSVDVMMHLSQSTRKAPGVTIRENPLAGTVIVLSRFATKTAVNIVSHQLLSLRIFH